ncbi:hypothetical protein WJS89_11055 [Sphingomicrobium sp. XHP0235]|uniref:hypothetical protein n=1 Tax=Sphingomicrobium aquimarinum TaxID=3133971 RepID=UPI0031FEDA39
MSRASEIEYKSRLDAELRGVGLHTASTYGVQVGFNENGNTEAWWLHNLKPNEAADTGRSKAYLRTYRWLASDSKIWAVGLPLRKKRVWLDRSVMKRLLDQNFVEFVEGKPSYFVITPKGEDWIGDI